MIQPASEQRVRDILTGMFGLDIRDTVIEGVAYSITWDEEGPSVVCRREEYDGYTVNDETFGWVQKWYRSSGEPLTEEYRVAIEATRKVQA